MDKRLFGNVFYIVAVEKAKRVKILQIERFTQTVEEVLGLIGKYGFFFDEDGVTVQGSMGVKIEFR